MAIWKIGYCFCSILITIFSQESTGEKIISLTTTKTTKFIQHQCATVRAHKCSEIKKFYSKEVPMFLVHQAFKPACKLHWAGSPSLAGGRRLRLGLFNLRAKPQTTSFLFTTQPFGRLSFFPSLLLAFHRHLKLISLMHSSITSIFDPFFFKYIAFVLVNPITNFL